MKKLIKELKERKEEAFETVYYLYYKLIYFVAYSIVNESGLAEEILQDTFIKMFENIDQYQGKGEFKSWLVSIARNLSFNEVIKRNKLNSHYTFNDELIDTFGYEIHNYRNLMLEIKECLDNLEATIVINHIIYGFTFKKIAAMINHSVYAVKNRYYNALDKLKKYYIGGKNEK